MIIKEYVLWGNNMSKRGKENSFYARDVKKERFSSLKNTKKNFFRKIVSFLF